MTTETKPHVEQGVDPGVQVVVRYWAGARAAAGVESEPFEAASVGELAELMRGRHDGLTPVLEVASLLIDGVTATACTRLEPGQVIEVLPPFAGG